MKRVKSEVPDSSTHPSSIVDATDGIIRVTRLQPPSQFIWKIESFSKLVDSGWEKIESGGFEADGYKWKLKFYPNGDRYKNGNGYISLYLSALHTEVLPLSVDLFVKLQFLVFNQIHDNYLVIQDVKDVCRFNRMKTEWGFAQLLSLDVFNEPSNGYLIDDCCTFGVDVCVIKSATSGETFSVVKPLIRSNSYTFKIHNYSTLFYYVESEVFTIEGIKWKLNVYPKGRAFVMKHVFLSLKPVPKLGASESKVYVKYKLRMIDQVHGNHHEKLAHHVFEGTNVCAHHPRFVSLEDVKNASKGYLVKDTIVVEVEFDYISVVKPLS